MNIILWLLIGSVTGWIFSRVTHRQTSEARGTYVLLGAIGSIVAALVWGQLNEPVITWFDVGLVLLALAGALVVVIIGYLILRNADKKTVVDKDEVREKSADKK